MSRELETVILFCLEHAADAPVAKRVSLYRGLAEFCGDEKCAVEFRKQAEALENADLHCREFALRLTTKLPATKDTK